MVYQKKKKYSGVATTTRVYLSIAQIYIYALFNFICFFNEKKVLFKYVALGKKDWQGSKEKYRLQRERKENETRMHATADDIDTQRG